MKNIMIDSIKIRFVTLCFFIMILCVVGVICLQPLEAYESFYGQGDNRDRDELGCQVEYKYGESNDNYYVRMKVKNTGNVRYEIQGLVWKQPNVTYFNPEIYDADYYSDVKETFTYSYLDSEIVGVMLDSQSQMIAPGELSKTWFFLMTQSESAPPDPDSFEVTGIPCTSIEFVPGAD